MDASMRAWLFDPRVHQLLLAVAGAVAVIVAFRLLLPCRRPNPGHRRTGPCRLQHPRDFRLSSFDCRFRKSRGGPFKRSILQSAVKEVVTNSM